MRTREEANEQGGDQRAVQMDQQTGSTAHNDSQYDTQESIAIDNETSHNTRESVENENDDAKIEYNIKKLSSSFSNKYIEYEVGITPEMETIEQFFQFLRLEFKNITQIVKYPSEYGFIKMNVEMNLIKIIEGGETELTKFNVTLPFSRMQSLSQIINIYEEESFIRLENVNAEGSGYIFYNISKFFISLAKDEININKYNGYKKKFIHYPSKLPGKNYVLNIQTEFNCVELSMIAHFLNPESSKAKPASFYEQYRGKYFNFPKSVNTEIKLEDFNYIEKATDTNIILYNISTKGKNEYDIRVVYKGNNSSVCKSRHIHLCSFDQHVALIINIQNFLHLIRYNKKKRLDDNWTICKYCIYKIKKEHITSHKTVCSSTKSNSRVTEIKPDET